MSEIIDFITEEKYYNYEGNHLMFPFLVALLYQNSNNFQYWHTLFFTFALTAFWEFVEFFSITVFGSYLLFGNDNTEHESLFDIILLDLGNGILGACLALYTLWLIQPTFKKTSVVWKIVVFLIFGTVYSIFSSYGWCQDKACTSFPWGNLANAALVFLYSILYLNRFAFDTEITVIYVTVALLTLLATSTKILPTAIMIYIAFLVYVIGITIYGNCKQNVEYERL